MLDITDPATGEVLTRVPRDTPITIAEKAVAARRTQPAWAARTLGERLECIARFRDEIDSRKDALAHTLTSEVGKPITQSLNELTSVLTRIDYFLHATAPAVANDEVFHDATMREVVSREPLGVVANISAWNYPYFVGSNVFVPALLTGNAVLYKPSEFATLTGLAITEMLHASGVPRDVFAPIVGDGAAGATLLSQRLDGVFFTGSYATGRRVAAAAGAAMVRVQLELGGKDPAYVCDDVDVAKAAASLADGAFYNAGQSCCSVERIYVHARVHDAFVDSFIGTTKGFIIGEPRDSATYIGPVTRRAQVEVLERQVADARGKGARIRCGGGRIARPGFWFEPTVLTEVDHTMEVMQEETFGPVIGIMRVRDDEEAVALMRDSEYGLTAGVYSRDEKRARAILAQVGSGTSYWNCCDRVSPRLPWSGRGHSGLGTTLGKDGILAFTQPRAWHLRAP